MRRERPVDEVEEVQVADPHDAGHDVHPAHHRFEAEHNELHVRFSSWRVAVAGDDHVVFRAVTAGEQAPAQCLRQCRLYRAVTCDASDA